MIAQKLLKQTGTLIKEADRLKFAGPVAFVYNPLQYAWKPFEAYIKKYCDSKKRVIFFGMNPGPWGMAQVGIPFGEITLVKEWIGIEERVGRPEKEHPKRPVKGFECDKSEVSGKRLWGLFKKRFGTPDKFFKDHAVLNYCPLVFMEEGGKNITPDKLKKPEQEKLFRICDENLKITVDILQPEWVIGVGNFVESRLKIVFDNSNVKTGRILHPSPASPAANKDWAGMAVKQMRAMGLWK